MKHAKKLLARAAWIGRTASTVFGLALVMALVVGVGTTALAAVPGDPFKLGRINTINNLSTLVGSVNDPMLRIDNNGPGTALDLQVQPGKAPMKVNSSKKVAKLNADKVDGLDAQAFLRADGKAQDAAKADFATFAGEAQNAQAANDADKLDGLDSTEIGINGYAFVKKQSAFDSTSNKRVSAACPPGKTIIGGGGDVFPTLNDPNRNNAPIALQTNGVNVNGFEQWDAHAVAVDPYGFDWLLTVTAVCADVSNP